MGIIFPKQRRRYQNDGIDSRPKFSGFRIRAGQRDDDSHLSKWDWQEATFRKGLLWASCRS